MSIGSQIKVARKEKGITQEELGEIIGRTKSSIANYENAVSCPNMDDMLKIMAALDVDANFIYEWDMHKKEKSATASYCDGLSERECEVALAYRKASDDDRIVVDAVLRKYIDPQQDTAMKAI